MQCVQSICRSPHLTAPSSSMHAVPRLTSRPLLLCCLCLRTHSTALHTTSIWSNTIGLQQDQAGTNSAIEASIYAPGGGGRGRDAKRQRAQELIEASELTNGPGVSLSCLWRSSSSSSSQPMQTVTRDSCASAPYHLTCTCIATAPLLPCSHNPLLTQPLAYTTPPCSQKPCCCCCSRLPALGA